MDLYKIEFGWHNAGVLTNCKKGRSIHRLLWNRSHDQPDVNSTKFCNAKHADKTMPFSICNMASGNSFELEPPGKGTRRREMIYGKEKENCLRLIQGLFI